MTAGPGKELIYLDNASTTFPKPRAVIEYMADFYSKYGVSPGRVRSEVATKAAGVINETRRRLTELFGGTDPQRLIFGYNITDSLNLLINSVLKQGDHVICTALEHNAVLRPLYFLNDHRGVELDIVPFDENGYINPEGVKSTIKENTKLVLMIHGSNVLGTIQPIKEVGAVCREMGVLFATDTAQTAGIVPIDIKGMNIDVACFTGHKSLLGPTGIGGMYVREPLKITPTRSGGTGILSDLREQPEEFPYCLEFGTPNLVGIVGLLAAQNWISSQGGIEEIHKREMKLADQLYEGLTEIKNVKLYCADLGHDHLPVLTFNVGGLNAADTGTKLDLEYNIANRSGLHCAPLAHKALGTDRSGGTVRLSIGPFNTEEDIDSAVKAVGEIARTARD
jgi:cysteine desulfurase/selenocysteine lyase